MLELVLTFFSFFLILYENSVKFPLISIKIVSINAIRSFVEKKENHRFKECDLKLLIEML